MSSITKNLAVIVDELNSGSVAALPTETVYGLSADATNPDAIKQIFKIKGRPLNHPLIMHVAPEWDLQQWVIDIPDYAQQLMKKFWPGPLTLVLAIKDSANISPLVNAKQESIAIRCPAHPKFLAVLQEFAKPLVAPSANPFGKISPTSAQHVAYDFPNEQFYILEGGDCQVGIESTIIDATKSTNYRILRHGIISQDDIDNTIATQNIQQGKDIKVSGNLKTHYQPSKPLFYFSQADIKTLQNIKDLLKNSYIISFSNCFTEHENVHQLASCHKKVAQDLYNRLRIADSSDCQQILIEMPENTHKWQGVIDRVKKAGNPQIF